MPITPWHIGPGIALKAVAGQRMSLLTFAASQAAMDVQVAYRILTQTPNPHGWTHTLVGAAIVAAATIAVTLPPVRLAEQLVSRRFDLSPGPWITTRAAWCGALLGTYSHVALDSIMHWDVRPFWPLSDARPLYQTLGHAALHDLCFWLGAAGLVAWAVTAAPGSGPPEVAPGLPVTGRVGTAHRPAIHNVRRTIQREDAEALRRQGKPARAAGCSPPSRPRNRARDRRRDKSLYEMPGILAELN